MKYKRRGNHDMTKYFRVREALDVIKEQRELLKQIEDNILAENGFFDKNAFRNSYYFFRDIVEAEKFGDRDKEYIAKMNKKLPEILYKIEKS